jgi:hypothetical protein
VPLMIKSTSPEQEQQCLSTCCHSHSTQRTCTTGSATQPAWHSVWQHVTEFATQDAELATDCGSCSLRLLHTVAQSL